MGTTLSAVAPALAFLHVVSIRVTSDMGSMSNYGHSGRLKITCSIFTNPSILFLAEMGNLNFPISPPSGLNSKAISGLDLVTTQQGGGKDVTSFSTPYIQQVYIICDGAINGKCKAYFLSIPVGTSLFWQPHPDPMSENSQRVLAGRDPSHLEQGSSWWWSASLPFVMERTLSRSTQISFRIR